MKNIKKNGQAALEFLMTYGWAIVMVSGLVAGLVYIMPHPNTMTVNKCLFGTGVSCLGVQLTEDNLTIIIKNGMGTTIRDIDVTMTSPVFINCTESTNILRADERLVVTCDNTLDAVGGKDTRAKMYFSYRKINEGYTFGSVGDVYVKYTGS